MQYNSSWASRWCSLVVFCGLGFSGCSVFDKSTRANAPPPPRIWLASELSAHKSQVQVPESSPPTEKALASGFSLMAPAQPYSVSVSPDQCWAQMIVHPRKATFTKQVITEEGRISYVIQPALLATTQQSVTIRDAAESFRVDPPQYKKVIEQVKVKDELKKFVVEPAVYNDEQEDVMIESPRVIMRSCRAAGQRIAGPRQPTATQTQCAVLSPAKYKTVTRKVLKKAETVKEVIIPAVYQNITKWSLVENGKAIPVELPAEQIQKSVLTVNTPAQALPHSIAPIVNNFQVINYENAPSLAWRQVVCEKDSSSALVEDLQVALKREGLEFGPVDGKLGKRTLQAVEAYQVQNGIASGFLTYETLEMLWPQRVK